MNYRVLEELDDTWSRFSLFENTSLGSCTVLKTSRLSQNSEDALIFCLEVYMSFSQAPLLEMMFEPLGFISDVEPALSIWRDCMSCVPALGMRVLP